MQHEMAQARTQCWWSCFGLSRNERCVSVINIQHQTLPWLHRRHEARDYVHLFPFEIDLFLLQRWMGWKWRWFIRWKRRRWLVRWQLGTTVAAAHNRRARQRWHMLLDKLDDDGFVWLAKWFDDA